MIVRDNRLDSRHGWNRSPGLACLFVLGAALLCVVAAAVMGVWK